MSSFVDRPPVSWLAGFVKFWYGFIIGDDWTMAAAVAVGLAITALLHAKGAGIWWLVPLIVIVMVGFDLERASRRARPLERPAEPSEH
jgi:hypothetical protein